MFFSESQTVLIDKIKFMDVYVSVYYDPNQDDNIGYCSWHVRNPKSFYESIIYMSPDGKKSYPEDAIIPEHTERDRELMPIFFLIGKKEMNEEMKNSMEKYLVSDHNRRNKKSKLTEFESEDEF